MVLSELLGELRGNLLRDASTLKSGPPDQFWSDESLVRYIDEAQRKFVRRTLCIKDDTTPAVTRVQLTDGKGVYTLHPSILYVTSARHQDAHADLLRSTHTLLWSNANPFADSVDYAPGSAGSMPLRFTTDEGLQIDDEHQIRMALDPVPANGQTAKLVHLRVSRLPLDAFSVKNLKAASEVPEDWQLDTLEWAAWRALRNWDLDAEDRRKAEQHKARFNEAVVECRHEVEIRKMHQPPTWGFGQGGFSYTR
jgi:hypothetical protein